MIQTFDSTLSSIRKSKKSKGEFKATVRIASEILNFYFLSFSFEPDFQSDPVKKMELKAKNAQVNGKTSANNQNVNSMNINQGNETSKQSNHADTVAAFANSNSKCLVSSPSSSGQPNGVHLENHVENANQSTFKLEFSETNLTSSTNSPYVNQVNSPCLNQANSARLVNSDLSFNSSFNSCQLIGDLENNPHLLNRSVGLTNNSPTTNSSTNLATHNMTNSMTNSMNSTDAIPISNLPNGQLNFNCGQQQTNFFNQSDDQLNNFDSFSSSANQTANQLSKANFTATKETCATCSNQIMDRYLLKLNGHSYHEKCLLCCCCGSTLNNVCYQKNSKLYCKQDYLR